MIYFVQQCVTLICFISYMFTNIEATVILVFFALCVEMMGGHSHALTS